MKDIVSICDEFIQIVNLNFYLHLLKLDRKKVEKLCPVFQLYQL